MVVQQDILNFALGMLALIPLSYPLRLMGQNNRFWYSLILGFVLQIWVYRETVYPVYVQHLIAYGLIKWKGPKCGKLVTFESILFLSGYHLYELFWNYGGWSMHAIALMMVLVPKYSMLAYNLEDGTLQDHLLTPEQQKYRIREQVSFLDFIGYLNFLPTSIMGPPFQYRDYSNFMHGEQVYASIPSKEINKKVLITLGETMTCLMFYIVSEVYFPLSGMQQDKFYNNSYWYVFFYVPLAVSLGRSKYYSAWKLSMCSVHASGLSYNGTDFSRINTANPVLVQTTIHVRQKINNWNIGVQEWLRKCIYQRCTIKSKSMSQLYVFTISAFWHGFYVVYYISFTLWFLQLYVQGLIFKYCKNGRSIFAKLYNKSGILGWVLVCFVVQILFSHSGGPFMILKWQQCLLYLQKVKFIPQLILFGLLVVFLNIRPPRDPTQPSADKEEKSKLIGTVQKDD